jgi:hypothetical protein
MVHTVAMWYDCADTFQVHPWVTDNGKDLLLSEEENTSNLVDPPTEAEMNAAITDNMKNLMTVVGGSAGTVQGCADGLQVKAVNKFKALIGKDKSHGMTSILGDSNDAHFSQPPAAMPKGDTAPLPLKSHSFNDLRQVETTLKEAPTVEEMSKDVERLRVRPVPTLSVDDTTLTEGLSQDQTRNSSDENISRMETIAEIDHLEADQLPPFRSLRPHAQTTDEAGRRGHAHDPLEDKLYLYIGPSTFSGLSTAGDNDSTFTPGDDDMLVVSESPGAADVDIYETAYRDEIERIMARAKAEKKEPDVYLTRRVDARLMAMSGKAGKWVAIGEEKANQIRDYTQFSVRKARVTEVSRALRQAAKEEYEKRRQEHRDWIAADKAGKAKAREQAVPKASTPGLEDDVDENDTDPSGTQSPGRRSDMWRGKAVDAGRQARTSFMGFVDMVKSKRRSKDELS